MVAEMIGIPLKCRFSFASEEFESRSISVSKINIRDIDYPIYRMASCGDHRRRVVSWYDPNLLNSGTTNVPKTSRPPKLELGKPKRGYPGITKQSCSRLANAAAICLEERRHKFGVLLCVNGICETNFALRWPKTDDQLRREWADPQEATENGAVAVAIALADKLTEYHIVERSWKSTGIDYWLGRKGELLFQRAARLEISGIRDGDENVVKARVKSKLRQSEQSKDTKLPVFVIVVEFGKPTAAVVKQ